MAQRPSGESFRCSFCSKSQDEVRKLIAGPKVYICDECIELCNDIIAEEWEEEKRAAEERAADAAPGPLLRGTVDYSLCGVATAMGLLIPVKDRGYLCFACLDAIRAAAEPSNGH